MITRKINTVSSRKSFHRQSIQTQKRLLLKKVKLIKFEVLVELMELLSFLKKKVKTSTAHQFYKDERYLKSGISFNLLSILKETYVKGVREKQINSLVNFMSPVFSIGILPNIYCFGKSGTGKTITTLITLDGLKKIAEQRDIPFEYVYINCSNYSTTYKALFYLLQRMGYPRDRIDRNTSILKNALEEKAIKYKGSSMCIVLDEVNSLLDPNDILYYLSDTFKNTGINIFLILITNVAQFYHGLKVSVKSRLQCREMLYSPYNAVELKEILKIRASKALLPSVYSQTIISKCAAYAAREYGDARAAITLLYYSIEIAKEKGYTQVEESHLDLAQEKIESEKYLAVLKEESTPTLAVFYSALECAKEKQDRFETGELYIKYKNLCNKLRLNALTQRRVSDILSSLDMLGLINAKLISKGRYGRTREILISLPSDIIVKAEKICKEGLGL